MDLKLEDRRALVTGSTAGIGLAIAISLAREGARVSFDNRAADRQTHAHATGLCRVECFKETRQSFRAQPGAGVSHPAQTAHELSAVLGFTYNFMNQSTQYQNGVDMHLDWGASQPTPTYGHSAASGHQGR
jgi:Putative MetA-pathway of phenol degradation